MKRKALALSLLLVIFVSLVAGMHAVEVADANFVPSSKIHVVSPSNTTYKSNAVLLNCSVVFTVTQNKLATYSLDGGANVTIINKQGLEPYVASEEFWGDIVLSDLAEGSHHLQFYSENIQPGYAEVYFSIETVTPEITPLPTINTGPAPYYFDDFLIGGIAGAVAIAVLVLLYYFKRK
jgi:hypothetical protein